MPQIRALAAFLALGALLTAGCATSRSQPDGTPGAPETRRGAKSRDLDTRAAILMAEDRREVTPALLAAAESDDAAHRALAARAIARIDESGAVDTLRRMARDPDVQVRSNAVFGLGLVGGDAAAAAVLAAVDDEAPEVRIHAAAALGVLNADESVTGLGRLLYDASPTVVLSAIYATASVTEAEFAAERLLQLAGGRDPELRFAAIHVLSRLAAEPRRLSFDTRREVRVRALELAKSITPVVRIDAARALRIPVGDDEAATLGRLTEDPDPEVKVAAIRSLTFPGAPIEPFLSETLTDDNERVLLASVQGLGRMRGSDVIEVLSRIVIYDEREWLREIAALSLGPADPDFAAGVARGLSGDESPGIRRAAARLLAGRTDRQSLQLAAKLAVDDDPSVRRAAIPALGGSDDPLSRILEPNVNDDTPGIRPAVARAVAQKLEREALGEDDREDCLALLERLASIARENGERETLLETVAAAERYGAAPRVRTLLDAGLGSEWHDVRRRAGLALGRLYQEDVRDRLGPPNDRTLDDYRRIAAWARSPRAARIKMERPGFIPAEFTVRLDTEKAPLTAWNFAQLAADGFYDGMPIQRVEPGFVVQTGDPLGEGSGGPGYSIRDEIAADAFLTGTLAMASPGADSAGSQWFITLSRQPQLMGRYTAFGSVVQNFPGVVGLLLPGDLVVRVEVYEGDGTEPLSPAAE